MCKINKMRAHDETEKIGRSKDAISPSLFINKSKNRLTFVVSEDRYILAFLDVDGVLVL